MPPLEDRRDLEEDLEEDLEDLRLRPPITGPAVVAEPNTDLKESAAAVVAVAIVDICFIY